MLIPRIRPNQFKDEPSQAVGQHTQARLLGGQLQNKKENYGL